jgi:hypothetical protein
VGSTLSVPCSGSTLSGLGDRAILCCRSERSILGVGASDALPKRPRGKVPLRDGGRIDALHERLRR